MRHRVTLWIALAVLSACGLTTDFDGFTSGSKSVPDAGDSGPTNSSTSSSSGTVTDDASTEAGVDAKGPPADAAPDANSGCTEDVLVGSNLAAPKSDGIDPQALDTYGYKAKKSGTGKCIWIYVNVVPPSAIVLGVYATNDQGTLPSKLLAEGLIAQPVKGWNVARASTPIPVSADAIMWIGVTALKPGLQVLEAEDNSCGALYLRTVDSTLSEHAPSPFPGTLRDEFVGTCNMAAYVSP